MPRKFEAKVAVREQVPLLIGLFGCSGSGKTFSALRLASGIQRRNPGPIFVIDTEAKRALHYADKFSFRHLALGSPFSPIDYLEAIEYCVEQGAKTLIIDSMTHEHTGEGGVLEMHEKELDRLSKGDSNRREAMNFPAWAKPKAQRTKLLSRLLQLSCNYILCFRAKEKIKLATKAEKAAGAEAIKPLGFMPVAGEEYVFEMTLNCLLLPAAGGVPTWHSSEVGERMMVKLPEQFKGLFRETKPLSEDIGEELAKWAAGAADPDSLYAKLSSGIAAATDQAALEALIPHFEDGKKKRTLTPNEYNGLRAEWGARKKALAEPPPSAADGVADDYDKPAAAADADPEPGSDG